MNWVLGRLLIKVDQLQKAFDEKNKRDEEFKNKIQTFFDSEQYRNFQKLKQDNNAK